MSAVIAWRIKSITHWFQSIYVVFNENILIRNFLVKNYGKHDFQRDFVLYTTIKLIDSIDCILQETDVWFCAHWNGRSIIRYGFDRVYFICPKSFARIHLPEYICPNSFARILFARNSFARILFARIHLPEFYLSEIHLPEFSLVGEENGG